MSFHTKQSVATLGTKDYEDLLRKLQEALGNIKATAAELDDTLYRVIKWGSEIPHLKHPANLAIVSWLTVDRMLNTPSVLSRLIRPVIETKAHPTATDRGNVVQVDGMSAADHKPGDQVIIGDKAYEILSIEKGTAQEDVGLVVKEIE